MDEREHHLSNLLGAVVADRSGRRIGRVHDLTLRLGDDAVVDRLLIATSGRRRPDVVVPLTAVEHIGAAGIVIDSSALASPTPPGREHGPEPTPAIDHLGHDELLLGRDVLDTQIIDIDGKRLARVADVVLGHDPEHGLTVIAVDTGFGAVCRRLGMQRLARRLDERAVAWDALHLTSARGHVVQLGTPAAAVHRLSPDDIALLLDAVTTQAAIDIIQTVQPDVAAAALQASHPHTVQRLTRALHHPDATPRRRTRRHDGWRRRAPARRGHA